VKRRAGKFIRAKALPVLPENSYASGLTLADGVRGRAAFGNRSMTFFHFYLGLFLEAIR
jgi:hypothetical protein